MSSSIHNAQTTARRQSQENKKQSLINDKIKETRVDNRFSHLY